METTYDWRLAHVDHAAWVLREMKRTAPGPVVEARIWRKADFPVAMCEIAYETAARG